ncbi:hypothetical protein OS175_04220 [Marinicella sp. S1101]|uniref:hypothetical protein n=1 Tax=Marinicella marina TaxID=2996016 RepID=UPI002260EE7E|nr:hypothetical protein [Marinicella marina]MCX7553073.1 hypothetical protein [Marinicella marina]
MRRVNVNENYVELENHYRGISLNSDLLRFMLLGSIWKFSEGGRTATPICLTRPFATKTFQIDVNDSTWDYYNPNGKINGNQVIPDSIYDLNSDGSNTYFNNHFIYSNLVGFEYSKDSYLFVPTLVLLNSIYSHYSEITRNLLTHTFEEIKTRLFDELPLEDVISGISTIPLKTKLTNDVRPDTNYVNSSESGQMQLISDGFNHFPISLFRDNDVKERIENLTLSIMNHKPVNKDHEIQVPPWIDGLQAIRAEGIEIPGTKNFLCLRIPAYMPPIIPDARLLRHKIVVHPKPGENPDPDKSGGTGFGNKDSEFDKDELEQDDTPGHDSKQRRMAVLGTTVINKSNISVTKTNKDVDLYKKNKNKEDDQQPKKSASGDNYGSNPNLGNAQLEDGQIGPQTSTLNEVWLAFKTLAERKEYKGLKIEHYTKKRGFSDSDQLRVMQIPMPNLGSSDDQKGKNEDEAIKTEEVNVSNTDTNEKDEFDETKTKITNWLKVGDLHRGLLVLYITIRDIQFYIFEVERKTNQETGHEYGNFRGYSFVLDSKGSIDDVIDAHMKYLAEDFGIFRFNPSTFEKRPSKFNHCKSAEERPFINLAINRLKKFGYKKAE